MGTHKRNPVVLLLASLTFLLFSFAQFCRAVNDTIRQGETIRDGHSLKSGNNYFQLGFFSPVNSTSRYLGIWYTFDQKAVVWVANRKSPISDRNGVLRIEVDGKLVLRDGNNKLVWLAPVTSSANNTAARLHNTGNFVLSRNDSIDDSDANTALWQSFSNPTDTFLPGMRVPVSSKIGVSKPYRSWKSATDPSPGNYSMGVDPNGGQQIVIWGKEGRRWRSGQWNLQFFIGIPYMSNNVSSFHGFKISLPDETGTMYITYKPPTQDLFRFVISWEGKERQLKWDDDKKKWLPLQSEPDPDNKCELYNYCGNYATCDRSNSRRICNCLEGFKPKFKDQWDQENWSAGCERKIQLQCQSTNRTSRENGKPDGFKKLKCTKLPDLATLLPSEENTEACGKRCLENCQCKAYAFVTGIRCMVWTGDLIDMQHFQQFQQAGNFLFFYRLHHSELDGGRKISNLVIVIICVVVASFLVASLWLLWRYKKKVKVSSMPCCKDKDVAIFDVSKSKRKEFSADLSGPSDILIDENQDNGPELPIFNFGVVAAATKNFYEGNILGQGGFGAVYKGELPGGKEIAVKRLSGNSGQGLEEFKTEIILIARLQHRNLVRLLGCSIQGEEKLLIYEYMPNKSLDNLLFDATKKVELGWRSRLDIIEGIARGLLYLHRDSRLRIIHRDLKASNILLDAEMNPKISDFGMARMFQGNQNEANTVRVVGTYGYMSPEYAMEGLFSVKSDVYSFGVLLLEIVSGQRNTTFRSSDHTSLLSYVSLKRKSIHLFLSATAEAEIYIDLIGNWLQAWRLWSEDKAMDLVDPSIRDTCSPNEVLKCIHIGMLCVQDSAVHRPTMAAVVLLLESETPMLPMPTKPTYTFLRSAIEEEYIGDAQEIVSSNDLTVTVIVGR
ncbi:hypothetical protein Godav_004371 [Gossypium davidsonii]|uniref:Receptor-like serine/threonine-protein kinase n=2 Tax=Gossypium TaxID=3633 RepID=A0A7J8SMC3_GOSDV|nr:hypothetical protein [Gossypium davidsonii]MBA0662379.1 hypothetical protein [Gossypium klotzschianum]